MSGWVINNKSSDISGLILGQTVSSVAIMELNRGNPPSRQIVVMLAG